MTAQFNPTESREMPARLMLEEVWSKGDLGLVDELTTPDYVEYDPFLPEPIRGRKALKQTIATFREGTPDLTKAVDGVYVDGDVVVVQYTATGTHEGPIAGIPPTGREIEVRGVFVYRLADGLLAEGTDLWDAFGLLRQVGALPDELGENSEA